MSEHRYHTMVVKIGTQVLTDSSGALARPVMDDLVAQVAELRRRGVNVVLVSSGAMGAGRALLKGVQELEDVSRRQLLASVGQIYLMEAYKNLFSARGYLCAQVLATKEDFRDRRHYLNMRNCFNALLRAGIIPVVNENDAVAVGELMFTDNDELAGLIAGMLNVDALIIITTVPGVLDEQGKLIERIGEGMDIEAQVSPGVSKMGRGGMLTKCRVARKLSALGISTHIVGDNNANVLLEILQGKSVGTLFPAASQKSNVKKWIAHAQGQEKGQVFVNQCAREVLCEKGKAASLLPVGIIRIEGEFEKGEIIKVKGEQGQELGYGIAQYGADKAREYMGKQKKPELIHYDYLYLA